MNNQGRARTIQDVLYEAPGPRTKKLMYVGTGLSLVVVILFLAGIIRQFYITGQLAPRYWSFFLRPGIWLYLAQGLRGTITVALVAGTIALVLGMLLMLGRISHIKPLSFACRVITNFFRGIPSLLLIYFFFLVVPQYGIKMSSFWMITLPISLAASAVLAEVFRTGVNAVGAGQKEAAYSLGMRRWQVTRKIVLPQAIRYIIPTLVSQLVVVVKDTTVAYVVSYPDLMQNARVLISNFDALVSVYFTIAVIYILLNYGLHHLSIFIARRLGVRVIR